MSLHRSLKTKPAGLNQHRNVLRRSERIEKLAELGDFDAENDSPFGLVKVGNRKMITKKKKAEATTDEEGGDETAAAAEGEGESSDS